MGATLALMFQQEVRATRSSSYGSRLIFTGEDLRALAGESVAFMHYARNPVLRPAPIDPNAFPVDGVPYEPTSVVMNAYTKVEQFSMNNGATLDLEAGVYPSSGGPLLWFPVTDISAADVETLAAPLPSGSSPATNDAYMFLRVTLVGGTGDFAQDVVGDGSAEVVSAHLVVNNGIARQ